LLLAYAALLWGIPHLPRIRGEILYNAVALCLPVNLLVFSLLRERGMFTPWGSTRFVFIALQGTAIALFMLLPLVLKPEWLTYRFVDLSVENLTPVSQPAALALVICLLFLNGRLFAQPTAQNSSLLGVLLAISWMLHHASDNVTLIVMTSASLMMLIVAVVQDSYSMAYIDQLTGLPGRRALNEQMLKLGNNFSIAMLDVDRFKKFNDSYGHDIGDQVLRMVASRIRDVGDGGKSFRYGGEEFCILFPGRKMQQVMDSLDEVRSRVAASRFDLRREDRRRAAKAGRRNVRRKQVTVTISIGVADRNERRNSAQEVLRAADKALYRAKKQGRNRVCK
jgi:diguanylate cyclase (GGDEF)-like protein